MHLLNYPCLSSAQMQYNVYIIGVNTFIIATAFVQSAIDDNISQEKSIFTPSFTQQRFEQNATSVYIYCSNCNSISWILAPLPFFTKTKMYEGTCSFLSLNYNGDKKKSSCDRSALARLCQCFFLRVNISFGLSVLQEWLSTSSLNNWELRVYFVCLYFALFSCLNARKILGKLCSDCDTSLTQEI